MGWGRPGALQNFEAKVDENNRHLAFNGYALWDPRVARDAGSGYEDSYMGASPKVRGALFGIPIIRTIVYWGQCLGLL